MLPRGPLMIEHRLKMNATINCISFILEYLEFTSINEFEKYIFVLVKSDDLLEIPVETPYFGMFPFK